MNERFLIIFLTAVNFTQMMDFVVMMPLGPQLMRVFGIDATRFAVAVSAYTFSAAIAAVAASLVIDRFERRRALLVLYAGFAVATLACAFAPDFHALVLARIAAGACGGVIGALVLAIVGDAVPYERRGAAMGSVMSAFALASILGVPAGVWLAALFGWHAAFIAIFILSLVVLAAGCWGMPVMAGHLVGGRRAPAETLRLLLAEPAHWRVFAFTGALVFAGFMVIPFIATFLSCNLGVSDRALGLVYLCGGLCAVVTSPYIGRLSDRHGKQRVFIIVALLAMLPTLALTHLQPAPLAGILAVTTAFIVIGSGRFVPATALITAAVAAPLRGSFMTLNTAVQSAGSGLAAVVAGLLIHQTDASTPLQGYGLIGWLSCMATVLGVVLVGSIRPWTESPPAADDSAAALAIDA
jgi:predicted MFS family arabinose efflux permease